MRKSSVNMSNLTMKSSTWWPDLSKLTNPHPLTSLNNSKQDPNPKAPDHNRCPQGVNQIRSEICSRCLEGLLELTSEEEAKGWTLIIFLEVWEDYWEDLTSKDLILKDSSLRKSMNPKMFRFRQKLFKLMRMKMGIEDQEGCHLLLTLQTLSLSTPLPDNPLKCQLPEELQ